MIKNRLIAGIFRLSAAAVIATGLLLGSGITGAPLRFLSYTGQSNMLCLAFLVYAAARSFVDLSKNGAAGSACYHPRLECGVLVTILFTMLIFWAVLVPFAGKQNLWTAGNLILHAISPMLLAADHILFCQSGRLKKYDAFLFALIPAAYTLECILLGICGVVFYTKDGISYYFPYLFMDFHVLGYLAALCILVIALAFVGASFLFLLLDKKWTKPAIYLFARHDCRETDKK